VIETLLKLFEAVGTEGIGAQPFLFVLLGIVLLKTADLILARFKHRQADDTTIRKELWEENSRVKDEAVQWREKYHQALIANVEIEKRCLDCEWRNATLNEDDQVIYRPVPGLVHPPMLVDVQDAEELPREDSEFTDKPESPVRVLVLDDDPLDEDFVRRSLPASEFHLYFVRTLPDLWEAYVDGEFDCVVVDLGEPGEPASEDCEKAAAIASKVTIPIVPSKGILSEEESTLVSGSDLTLRARILREV